MYGFDEIDLKIMELLQRDGRTPYAELAKAVGLAVSSVNERVRKLNERGAISGVHARLAHEAVGLDLLAFVFVAWSKPDTEARFLAKVAAEPVILECHHVTGAWNYLLKVRVKNTRMLEAFLANVVKAIEGVQRTETFITLSTPKETASLPTAKPDWFE